MQIFFTISELELGTHLRLTQKCNRKTDLIPSLFRVILGTRIHWFM